MPRRFGERWEVVEPLGEGGQAHTFLVRDLRDGTTGWVLKRLKNPKRIERFEREITALTRLNSAHVPRVVDHSVDEPTYLVTAFAGTDLTRRSEGRLTPRDLLERFRGLVIAAADAHRVGIVHRDIKPDNVTVDDAGVPYLVDFGICADDQADVVLTTTSEGFGNRSFAAPECEPGSLDDAVPASDIYSLGKLLYWMSADGQTMVRERWNETALTVEDPFARAFISGLIRHTVLEDRAQRWTTASLLEGIEWCLAKWDEHETLRSRGIVIVADGFGPNDAYYAGGSRSATTPSSVTPLSGHQVAEAFTTADAVLLERIDVALRLHGGSDRGQLLLVADLDGKPSARILERWEFNVPDGPDRVVALPSANHTRLEADSTYWVALSALDPGSNIAWVSAAIELSPRASHFAERDLPGDWRPAVSPGGPGHALRVLARSLP